MSRELQKRVVPTTPESKQNIADVCRYHKEQQCLFMNIRAMFQYQPVNAVCKLLSKTGKYRSPILCEQRRLEFTQHCNKLKSPEACRRH